jgi:hypothetical protein
MAGHVKTCRGWDQLVFILRMGIFTWYKGIQYAIVQLHPRPLSLFLSFLLVISYVMLCSDETMDGLSSLIYLRGYDIQFIDSTCWPYYYMYFLDLTSPTIRIFPPPFWIYFPLSHPLHFLRLDSLQFINVMI